MVDEPSLLNRMIADVYELNARAVTAEMTVDLVRREIQHAIDNLPFPEAKSGQTYKVRRRLARFLEDRLI